MDRILNLHFIDGTKLSFDFADQSANAAARQLKVADFMTGKHLVIEAEGTLMIFPVSNIKYIAFSAPRQQVKGVGAGLPRHTIVGARIRN